MNWEEDERIDPKEAIEAPCSVDPQGDNLRKGFQETTHQWHHVESQSQPPVKVI